MKILKVDMTVFREDGEDFDESIENEFVNALVDTITNFNLLFSAHMKVVDDEEDE